MLEKIENMFNNIKKECFSFSELVENMLLKDSYIDFPIDIDFKIYILSIADYALKILKDKFKKWVPPWIDINKKNEWESIYRNIYNCNSCVCSNRINNKITKKAPGLFFDSCTLPILVLSDSPGLKDETMTWKRYGLNFGSMFTGNTHNNTFNSMCEEAGLTKQSLFICPITKCCVKLKEFENIDAEFYNNCFEKYTKRQIELFDPVILWALGSTAQEFLRDIDYNSEGRSIKTMQRKEVTINDNFMYIKSSHPNYINNKKNEFWFIKNETALMSLIRVFLKLVRKEIL